MRQCTRLFFLCLAALGGCKGNAKLVGLPEQIDTFTQSASTPESITFTQRPGMIDILFVVSNSPSMCVKSAKVAAAFSDFLSKIEGATLDYHIGVVTSDLTNPDTGGVLVRDSAGDTFLTNQNPDAQTAFSSIISAVGSNGSPDSQPLLAAATALQDPLKSGANRNFLRLSASLAVIVVDDEDDFSLTLPPEAGGENVGGGIYGDPVGLYFARLFKSIKGPGQDALVTVSAIAGAAPDTPPDAGLPIPADCTAADAGIESSCVFLDNSAYAGVRLFGVVGQTGGLSQSICEPNFEGILENLGNLLVGLTRSFAIAGSSQQVSLQSGAFTVTVTPPSGTPQVIPQSATDGWTFDATSQTLEFNGSYVPPAGSSIAIGFAQLQSTFHLTYSPQPGSLVVQVNGVNVPPSSTDPVNGYVLDLPTQSLIFPPANIPPPGATITAEYQYT